MQKPLAALLFIVAVPLAVVFAQGVVAPTPQGGGYGVQAEQITVQGIPTPRQLWRMTTDSSPFVVPQDKVLVVTGAAWRGEPLLHSSSVFRLLMNGSETLYGIAGWSGSSNSAWYPGYRIDPGSSVEIDLSWGNGYPEGVIVLGYMADR